MAPSQVLAAFFILRLGCYEAARVAERGVALDTAETETLHTAELEADVKTEMFEQLPQKFRIPAVTDEGGEMTFRDPVSVQLLQAEVPKGVRRGEPFFVWVRQPESVDGRATVFKTEPMSNDFVPIAEPVLEVESKEVTSISIGGKDEALLPALVPGKGSNYSFELFEQVSVRDGLVGDRSKFRVTQKGIGNILRFEGKATSSLVGHSTIRAYDMQNSTVFKMRMPKHNWLPGRWTWRMLAPNGTQPLFTLTKSIFGTGALWMRSVWHIYKGRKRDGQLVYFCKGDHLDGADIGAGKIKCYSSEAKAPLAILSQKSTLGAYVRGKRTPDEYDLEVGGEQDAGLLIAWAVLHDYTKDQFPKAAVALNMAFPIAGFALAAASR